MAQMYPPENMIWKENMPQQAPPPRKRAGVRTVILTLVLVCAVAVLLNESILKIRHIAVVGNKEISWDEVVSAAGLDKSISYFALNEEKIAAGINANRYLIFEKMEKSFPGSVVIYVKERVAQANVQVMGVTYQLDDKGMVLERIGATLPQGELVNVTGFQAKEVRVGHIIVPGTAEQMDAYELLMEEIFLQGFSDQVSELNLSNPDSLYLITTDGYTAHLGDMTEMRAKIGTVRAVVAKLREMGKEGGVIEASVPAVATYTPSEL